MTPIHDSNARGRFRTLLALGLLGLLSCACGGSGSSGSSIAKGPAGVDCAADQCGTALIAVTDADGDFVSYTVDILSLKLRRADGSTVETLPATTRVDFAALTDLSELISAATLAPGDIVGGTIRLDYGDAEVYVESGDAIVPAQVVDESGSPLGIVDFRIDFANRDHLVITRGRVSFLSIDFDLAASHEVDTSVSPALVTARPSLLAEVAPIEQKELRVRGALIDVDLDAGSYDIHVRPWHHRDGDHGLVTVATTDTTSFEIGGTSYTGADGLAALADLDPGTLTVAFGTLDLQQHTFTASIVEAGDSVGGETYSAVYGNVVARSGDELTVKGALAVFHDRRPARFRRTVVVTLGPDTAVSMAGDSTALLGKDDISVGQRIVALGQFTNPELTSDAPLGADVALALDATQGRVRLLATRLQGSVTSIVPGQLNMHLRAIDRLSVEMFDFAGTGTSPAGDADPLDYEIDTGTLSLGGLEVDEWARVLGFVEPFGMAPPDFAARTVVSQRDTRAALGIGWGENGTNAPFSSMEPTGLTLDLGNDAIGLRHHLLIGRSVTDLFDLPDAPPIVPTPGRGVYGLWEPGHVELFADFATFVDELAMRIGGGEPARSLSAYGVYDEASNTLTADHVVVFLSP